MTRRATTILAAALLFSITMTVRGASAPHDLAVKLEPLNLSSGTIQYPGPVRLRMTVTNLGPVRVTGSYKMMINKYDHTGQQFLKTVFVRDLPLLATSGDLRSFIYQVEDTAGSHDSGKTFIYRAFLGPGYYTDPVNKNNSSNVGVRYVASTSTATPLAWRQRLTPADFTRAGATLTQEQINKLNNTTYTLQSIVSSNTDRLTDSMRCVNCHTGTSGQSVPYRPELGSLPLTKLMNHRPTATSEIVGGYNWQNETTAGVLGKFMNNSTKPDALRKIFRLWLNEGRR